jgi:hypothetical protein
MLKYKKWIDCEAVDAKMNRLATYNNGLLKIWQSEEINENYNTSYAN